MWPVRVHSPIFYCCQLSLTLNTGNGRYAVTFVFPERQSLRYGLWSALSGHAIRITVRVHPNFPYSVRPSYNLYS